MQRAHSDLQLEQGAQNTLQDENGKKQHRQGLRGGGLNSGGR